MKKLACMGAALVLVGGCHWFGADKLQDVIERGELQPLGAGEFSFVVMGNCRPPTGGADAVTPGDQFTANIERCNDAEANFAVLIGDSIAGRGGKAALLNDQWDSFDAARAKLTMPSILVPGAGDTWGRAGLSEWKRRHGRLYFSWDHKSAHFIALCSDVPGQEGLIGGEQLEWLAEDLRESFRSRRIFVFMAEPLWTYGGRPSAALNQWNTEVHPLLTKYGVDTVFAGGWHRYCMFPRRDGVRYVVTGGGGAEMGPYELAGEFPHFVKVSVSERGRTSLRVVTAGGALPAECVISEPLELLRESLDVVLAAPADKGGQVELRITVPNPTDVEARAVVTWAHEGSTWKPVIAETKVPPGQRGTIVAKTTYERLLSLPSLHVELLAGEKKAAQKLFGWPDSLRRVITVAPVRRTKVVDAPKLAGVKIDGETTDWAEGGLHIQALSTVGRAVASKGAIAPQVRLGWDPDGLLVAVTVRDDTISVASGGRPLSERDSVEFYVSPGTGSPDVYSVTVAPPGEAGGSLRMRLASAHGDKALKAQVASVLRDDGYVVEVCLPWSNLGLSAEAGREVGVQVLVNDHDGAGPVVRLGWYPMGHPFSAIGGFSNICRVRLAAEASEPEFLAVRAGTVLPLGSGVELVAPADTADRKVALKQGETTLAKGVLRNVAGQARADFVVPLSPQGGGVGVVDIYISGTKIDTVDLGGARPRDQGP